VNNVRKQIITILLVCKSMCVSTNQLDYKLQVFILCTFNLCCDYLIVYSLCDVSSCEVVILASWHNASILGRYFK